MARAAKTARSTIDDRDPAAPRRRTKAAAPVPKDRETRIVDAAMALAAEQPWNGITLADIATRAGLDLAEFHPDFAGKGRILSDYARRIDARMLAGDAADLAGEQPRERLFDIVMRRFDLMAGDRDALRSISRDLARDPIAALGQAGTLDRSMAWTLEAAGLSAGGWRGRLKVRALGMAYLATLRVWLEDGPDLAKTMAELDRRLARLDGLARRFRLVMDAPAA